MLKKLVLKDKCLVLKRLLRIAYSAMPDKHAYVSFAAFHEDGEISCHDALEMLRAFALEKIITVNRIYINDADGRSKVDLMRRLVNKLSFKMTQTTIDSIGYTPKTSDQIKFEIDYNLAEQFLKKHDTSYSDIDLGFVQSNYKGMKLKDDGTLYLRGQVPVVLSPKRTQYVKELLQAWPKKLMPYQFKLFNRRTDPNYYSNLRNKLIKYLSGKFNEPEEFIEDIFVLDESQHFLK